MESREMLSYAEDADISIHDLLDAVNGVDGRRGEDFEVKEAIPVPCFVIKTKDNLNEKTFINVCGSREIPAPGDWSDGKVPKDVVAALKEVEDSNEHTEAIRFPLSVGPGRRDVDKQGEGCVVFDCCFNLDVAMAAKTHRKFRNYLVGLAIEWVALKNEVNLSEDFKLPKMKYKGKEIRQHRFKVKRNPVVQEVKEVDEASSFALPVNASTKNKPPKQESKETSSTLPKLHYKLVFENPPVEKILVEIDFPIRAANVVPKVWVSGFELHVELTGMAQPLSIELPLPVDASSTRVVVYREKHQISITLPLKPITSLLQELRQKKQDKRGGIPLKSDQGFELEAIAS